MEVEDDKRIGELVQPIGESCSDTYDIVILGFPHEEGVARNGGRVGAKNGPSSVRKLFKRIGAVVNLEYGTDVSGLKLGDAGDVDPNCSFDEAHALLVQRVARIISTHKAVPFVIGGGNDQSYSNALGLLQSVKFVSLTLCG